MPTVKEETHYEVLAIERTATEEEIRKAFQAKAFELHPDRGGDATRFKRANEAYQILCDIHKRRIYDQNLDRLASSLRRPHPSGPSSARGHSVRGDGVEVTDPGWSVGISDVVDHMHDAFQTIFSRPPPGIRTKGDDVEVDAHLTLEEAAFGCKKEVTFNASSPCQTCGSSGARPGTKPMPCTACGGKGQTVANRGFVAFGQPCVTCRGRGKVVRLLCPACAGRGYLIVPKRVVVTFPAGIDSFQRMRVQGLGLPGQPFGDLYIQALVEPDSRFERDGYDLITRVKLNLAQSLLGCEVEVPILVEPMMNARSLELKRETKRRVKIPPGVTEVVLDGLGVHNMEEYGRGDLIVLVEVKRPEHFSSRARRLLEELSRELGDEQTVEEAEEEDGVWTDKEPDKPGVWRG